MISPDSVISRVHQITYGPQLVKETISNIHKPDPKMRDFES